MGLHPFVDRRHALQQLFLAGRRKHGTDEHVAAVLFQKSVNQLVRR